MSEITQIPIDNIADQELRREVSERGLVELADSIKRVGILQPLLVAKDEEGFCLIAGQRRLKAARIAGRETVPCIIIEADHEQALIASITENIQRESIDAATESEFYWYLAEKLGKNNKQIAQMISKSASYVSQRLTMRDWLPDIVDAVKHGQVSFTVGRELARVTEKEHAIYLLHLAIRDGANYRTARYWVQQWQASLAPSVNQPDTEPDDTKDKLERALTCECYWCSQEAPVSTMATIILCPVCMKSLKEARNKDLPNKDS